MQWNMTAVNENNMQIIPELLTRAGEI